MSSFNRVFGFLLFTIAASICSTAESSDIKSETITTGKGQFAYQSAFSPDGKILALAYGKEDGPSVIKLISIATYHTLGELRGHNGPVDCLQFTPLSNTLISGGRDNQCIVWDVVRRKEIARLKKHTDSILSLSISPDGSQVATSSGDKSILVWDLRTHKVIVTLIVGQPVRKIIYISNNVLATGGSDGMIRFWDLTTKQDIMKLRVGKSGILSMAVTSDGKRMLTGSKDGVVKFWEFSLDNKTGNDLAVWKFGRGQPLSLAFIPNKDQIAIGSWSGQLIICSLKETSVISELRINAHSFPIFSVAVSPDGESIVSSSALESDAKPWKNCPK